MSHELFRLSERVYGTPLLASQETIQGVCDFLDSRNGGLDLARGGGRSTHEDSYGFSRGEVGVATMRVEGPLSYNLDMMGAICGNGSLSSYGQIRESLQELKNFDEVSTLAVFYDTGGGEARGCFETAQLLRSTADELDIKLVSFIEGNCCSAGYALASTAHEIVMMNDNAVQVGSIGVVSALKNSIPKEMKEGSEILFVTSGEGKVPFNEDGRFSKEFLASLQEKSAVLYGDFLSHVSEFRGMSTEVIKSLGADTFNPEKALSIGLVDKVMGRGEFFEYLADLVDENETAFAGNKTRGLTNMSIEDESTLSDLQAVVTKLTADLADAGVQLQTVTDEKEALLSADSEREATAVKTQLEGFSFDTDGVLSVLLGMEAKDSTVLLSAFDDAQEKLEAAELATAEAVEKGESGMFSQESENGESVDLGADGNRQAAVMQKINSDKEKV